MNTNLVSTGLLIIRVGLGLMMILHGWPKISGGAELWEGIGSSMSNFGIESNYAVYGFLAAFSEFVGGFLLLIGYLTRPVAALLAFTMLVATVKHFSELDNNEVFWDIFRAVSYPLELFWVFIGLVFAGPGKFSLSSALNYRGEHMNDFEEF